MNAPFSAREFLDVFARYNTTRWWGLCGMAAALAHNGRVRSDAPGAGVGETPAP